MSWMKKTCGFQVRLSTTSSRNIMFVSVPFVPGDPRGHYRWAGWLLHAQWLCVQPRSTELGNLLLYLQQVVSKTALCPGKRHHLIQLPGWRAAWALHSQHTEWELTRCSGLRQVASPNRKVQRADSSCAGLDLVLAGIYSGMAWDFIYRLLALHQYSQIPIGFWLLCVVSS